MFAVSRAHLVTGARWYVDYTTVDLITGQETRRRQDFDLNEISDLEVRRAVGERLVKYLSVFLDIRASVQPICTPTVENAPPTVGEALQRAIEVKTSGQRTNTHKTYRSIGKIFRTWIEQRQYAGTPLPEFGRRQCRAFFDYLNTRQAYRGCTLNNYLTALRILWGEMIHREMCQENPWKTIKPVRVEEKRRRPFTPEERRVVAGEIEKTDYWLFRGLLLQFFCYVRPVELCRLRFRNFQLAKGLLKVESYQSKTWVARWITLPASILPYFVDGVFDRQPANFYVFGRGIVPGSTPTNEHRMYRRHRNILERLQEDGRLGALDGLTWYSWKDTGISMHSRSTSLLATKDQAGHTSTDMTLIYYQAEQVNAEYLKLGNDLFG